MRLIELKPRWIHPNLMSFLCPHCRANILTVKDIVMHNKEQRELYESVYGDDWNKVVVPCSHETIWTFSTRDFETMSITPSIDASPAGCWHGYVMNGAIT